VPRRRLEATQGGQVDWSRHGAIFKSGSSSRQAEFV